MCIPLLIAALFIIDEVWKQPKCPSVVEHIKLRNTYTHTCTHTHTLEYYPAIKKKEFTPFVTWVGLKETVLTEIKDKHCLISLTNGF